jgi:hypothetical protein
MSRSRTLLAILIVLTVGLSPRTSPANHCASKAKVTPVEGAPGQFQITTSRGSVIARTPPTPRAANAGVLYTINGLSDTWDADNNSATVVDTLIVPIGSTVRWHLVTGIHTITNGHDSADPEAGKKFDYLLTTTSPNFDSTFTQPTTVYFFCYFHEPSMVGTLIVRQTADVPGGGATTVGFSRPPSPNPSRGTVSFAITLPREQQVEISVLDIAGRRIATVARDRLSAGEHPFRWDGRTSAGQKAPAGQYRIRLRAESAEQTRAFSLLR